MKKFQVTFYCKKYFYCVFIRIITIYSISVSVSVSANMKNVISVFYRYRPIRKLSLSGFIGIGRYEKKLISRTLAKSISGGLLKPKLYLVVYTLDIR